MFLANPKHNTLLVRKRENKSDLISIDYKIIFWFNDLIENTVVCPAADIFIWVSESQNPIKTWYGPCPEQRLAARHWHK